MKKKSYFPQVIVLSFLALVISLASLAQERIGPQNIINIGEGHEALRLRPKSLQHSVEMSSSLSRPSFFSGVGGVSFDQTAQPVKGLEVESLDIGYDPDATDGERLLVKINGKHVRSYIPDWQLVPVAKYAQSDYYSCFTIFGSLQDSEMEELIVDNGGRIMNYHPDLDNTLLGMRLAYLDMLLLHGFVTDLPRNDRDQYVLGAGEEIPDVDDNEVGQYFLISHSEKVSRKYGYRFRSYVICDYDQTIGFNLNSDSLIIYGVPFYYCWMLKQDQEDYYIGEVTSEINNDLQREKDRLQSEKPDFSFQEWVIGKLLDAAERYEGNYYLYNAGTFIEMMEFRTKFERRTFLKQYDPNSLYDMLVEIEANMDANSVVYLKNYSRELSSKPQLFENTNPAVWNAALQTLRYAAFFRYVKQTFPERWNAFHSSIKEVTPQPEVITPTVLYESGNEAIKDALGAR